MAYSLLAGLKWFVGLLFFSSSSLMEAPLPRRFGPNPNPNPLAGPYNFLVNEQFRTAYHFQPLRNWMNDPNAPMYYKGLYHFFYQSNPNRPQWVQNITWGHAVSKDLVDWTIIGPALSASEPFDINGCWSGSATMLRDNKPVIVYTAIDEDNRQVQVVAHPKDASDPYLREWVKPDYNPIIEPFEGVDVTLFRDPSTAWVGQDGEWRLIVGTVLEGDGHAVLYRSHDFVKWVRAEHPLFVSTGSGMFECVDFFPLGVPGTGEVKYVLKVSMFVPYLVDQYLVGTYNKTADMFVADDTVASNDRCRWPTLDYGHIYASKTFFDDKKQRRILWGWSNESDSAADDLEKGWAGVQIVPRVLTLDNKGERIVQWPVEEIERLRSGDPVQKRDIELRPGSQVEIKGIDACQVDVEVEFELPSLSTAEAMSNQESMRMDPPKLCREMGANVNAGLGSFGLLVLAADDLDEHTAVYFRVFRDGGKYEILLCVDERRSSKSEKLYKPASGGFVDVDIVKDGGKISLRTLIDHSVVESFGGGGKTVITSRVYPTLLPNGNTHLYAFNNGTGTVKISHLKAWNMSKASIVEKITI